MPRDEDESAVDDSGTARVRRVMAQLDDADLELLEPPASVWSGIEDAVGSEAARRPPVAEPPASHPMVVEYRIDDSDDVVEVGGGWAEFARANDATELAGAPLGRTLWSFIDDAGIRELWQLVVQRVRDRRQEARVPLRCDGPRARRWFEMTVTPEADDGVRFRSVLVFEESRPPVALLDRGAQRAPDAPPVALCSWCGRGRLGGQWLDVEELVRVGRLLERAAVPPITHGICAGCRDMMRADLLVADRRNDSDTT